MSQFADRVTGDRCCTVIGMGSTLFYTRIDDSPVGALLLAGDQDALHVLSFVVGTRPREIEESWTPDTKGVLAWDVRVADGKVTAGFGKPPVKDLLVERATDPDGTVRFKLGLPAGKQAVTIAYADSDGGGKIERRIATSALSEGRVQTLGKLAGAADHVRCAAQDGGLVPELVPERLPVP